MSERLIVNGKNIKLSKEAKEEITEIEKKAEPLLTKIIAKKKLNDADIEDAKQIKNIVKKIRGDMTDEEWAFFKTIKCITPVDEYLRLEKEAGNDIVARNPATLNTGGTYGS